MHDFAYINKIKIGTNYIPITIKAQYDYYIHFINYDDTTSIVIGNIILEKEEINNNADKIIIHAYLYNTYHEKEPYFTISTSKFQLLNDANKTAYNDIACSKTEKVCVLYNMKTDSYATPVYFMDGTYGDVIYRFKDKLTDISILYNNDKSVPFCINDNKECEFVVLIVQQYDLRIVMSNIVDHFYTCTDMNLLPTLFDNSVRTVSTIKDIEKLLPCGAIYFDNKIINDLFADFIMGRFDMLRFCDVVFELNSRYDKGYMSCDSHGICIFLDLKIKIDSMKKSLREAKQKVYNYRAGTNIAFVKLADNKGNITYFYSSKKLGVLSIWTDNKFENYKLNGIYSKEDNNDLQNIAKFNAYGYDILITGFINRFKIVHTNYNYLVIMKAECNKNKEKGE